MNDKYVSKGDRITRERKRLNLTQKQAADACEVSRVQWGRYEREESELAGRAMRAFIAIGADEGYIETGLESNATDLALAKKLASPDMPDNASELHSADLLRRSKNQSNREIQLQMVDVMLSDMSDDYFNDTYDMLQRMYLNYKSGKKLGDNERRKDDESSKHKGHNVEENKGVVAGDGASFGDLNFNK